MSHKKQIFKINILKKLLTDENSCVFLVPSTRLLALPPFFLNNMKSGILYMLNNMLKKYDRSLGGIVIGYQNIKVLMDENTWIIPIGTSEIEINVNVEFYIFQPKIGSYLEGAVNKKSNNHIGCLVHRYFNATILKPEDIDYENWSCKDLNVDDIIIFRVKDLDFTSLLPYIEGTVDDDNLLNKIKSKISGHCDIGNTIKKVANKSYQDKISFSEKLVMNGVSLDKKFDVILENKEVRNKNEEVCALKYNLDRNLEEVDSSLDSRKKKNKNAKKELLISISKAGKEKNSNEQEKNSSIFNETSKLNEKYLNKEKKKKKKIHDVNNSDVEENSVALNSITEESNPDDISCNISKNYLQIKNEDLNNFIKFFKNKKEEKKKKDKETLLNSNKSIQCLSSKEVEDNVLYSTMIEPFSSKKMKISYCSPIPRSVSLDVRTDEESSVQDLDASIFPCSRRESDGKEKGKKRHKKRKKENKKEDFSIPEKFETSHTFLAKNKLLNTAWNADESKIKEQDLVEELYKQQLDRAKEALNMSDKEGSKKLAKKKTKIKKVVMEICPDVVLNINKNIETQFNGTVDLEGKSEAQSLLSKLYEQEIQRMKGELSMSDKETFKLTKKAKSKMIKQEKESSSKKTEDELFKEKKTTKAELNGKSDSEQDMLQKLYTQEMNRVKEELRKHNNESAKLAKKCKTMTKKHETLKEGTCDSLYNKLLREAKSSVSLEKGKLFSLPILKESRKKRQKKDCEPSKILTNSSEKNDIRKKKKNSKYEVEDCHDTFDKFRNGSMYDVAATPEKINPDVSPFFDSEQSHASPVKREKKVNGTEFETGKSVVQNMLDQFCNEEIKRLNSQSDRKKKKKKIQHNSEILNENEESLYEKLLRNAKSLIDNKDHQRKKKK